jgi:hypothetical protein
MSGRRKQRQQKRSECALYRRRNSMAKIALAGLEFDPDCEDITIPSCGLSCEDAVYLGEMMAGGKFGRAKTLRLVRFTAFIVLCLLLTVEVLFLVTRGMQSYSSVFDAGAISLGKGLKSSTSLRTLHLVSCPAVIVFCYL